MSKWMSDEELDNAIGYYKSWPKDELPHDAQKHLATLEELKLARSVVEEYREFRQKRKGWGKGTNLLAYDAAKGNDYEEWVEIR